jgi:lactoylglutathione lyase
MKMFDHVDYVMVTVSDMSQAISFYRDLLGMTLKMESPGWTEFQTGKTTLALHGGGVKEGGSKPGAQPAAGTCSIGFNVEDVQKTYDELTAKGARFVMPPTRMEEEGITLAVCLDPDGLPVSFAQLLNTK